MCGRFVIDPDNEEHFFEHFSVEAVSDFKNRYNVAPTQQVPVIRNTDGSPEARWCRWGLVPSWAKDMKIGARMINARSETAAEKPSFKKALAFRRCIVPATGWYEWKKVKEGKQPYLIRRADSSPIAFAGIWETWSKGEDGPLETFSILTTSASQDLEWLHERMPVVLEPDNFERWLDPGKRSDDEIVAMMATAATGLFATSQVSQSVGNVRNDSPDLVKPIADLF